MALVHLFALAASAWAADDSLPVEAGGEEVAPGASSEADELDGEQGEPAADTTDEPLPSPLDDEPGAAPPAEITLAPGLSSVDDTQARSAVPPDAIPREVREKGTARRKAKRELMKATRATRKEIRKTAGRDGEGLQEVIAAEVAMPPPLPEPKGVRHLGTPEPDDPLDTEEPEEPEELPKPEDPDEPEVDGAAVEGEDPGDPLGDIAISDDMGLNAFAHPWGRSPEGIARAIENIIPHMETCAAEHLSELKGEQMLRTLSVRLQFDVDAEGAPGEVAVASGERGPFSDCVSNYLEELRFHPGDLPQSVQIPVYVRVTR